MKVIFKVVGNAFQLIYKSKNVLYNSFCHFQVQVTSYRTYKKMYEILDCYLLCIWLLLFTVCIFLQYNKTQRSRPKLQHHKNVSSECDSYHSVSSCSNWRTKGNIPSFHLSVTLSVNFL